MKYFKIQLELKPWIPIVLVCMTLIHSTTQIKFKASPCPKKFSYEPRDSNEDRWYGDVTLPIDGTIEGSTIRLGLDKPSQLLVTTAGPITTNDNQIYIVTHDNVVLEKGSTYKLTFMVKFDKNYDIPMLETIHFNGRRICPEQDALTLLTLDGGNERSSPRPDPKGTESTDVFSDIDKRPNNPTRTTTRATIVNHNNEGNFNVNSESSNINRFTTSRTTTNNFNGVSSNNQGFNNGGTGSQSNTGFNSGATNNFGGVNTFGGNTNPNQGNNGFGTSDPNFGGSTGNFGTNSNTNQGGNEFNSNFGGTGSNNFGTSNTNQGSSGQNNFGGTGSNNFGTSNTNQGSSGQNNFGGSGSAQGNSIRDPNQGINNFNTGSSSNFGSNGGSSFNTGSSNHFSGNQGSTSSDQVACGTVSTSIANPLITLPQNTRYGEYPWHAALFMRDEFNSSRSSYICGGSLVSKNKIITAAHCVSSAGNRIVNPDSLTIYMGKYNIHTDESTTQKKKVTDLKVNPKYNKANFHDDIAILSLASDVEFTNYVRPICIWEAVDGIEDVINKEGYVVGWGYNERSQLNEELKMAPMPIVSADKCARSDAAFFAEYVSENAFCAGYKNGTGPCKGDSGGGLVLKRDNAWYLRGIVSVSAAPKNGSVCNTYHYIVFTDVAKYSDFIRRNL